MNFSSGVRLLVCDSLYVHRVQASQPRNTDPNSGASPKKRKSGKGQRTGSERAGSKRVGSERNSERAGSERNSERTNSNRVGE